LIILTACGTGGLEPSSQAVRHGLVKFNEVIALQLSQTPQQPSRRPQLPSFKINHLVVSEHKPLMIQDLPGYQVRGMYDLTIQLQRRRETQQQNPFDIYLQRQKEGKTWRLAISQPNSKDSTPVWLTYSIR